MGLSRREFFSRIGLDREVEPLTEAAYEFFEWLEMGKPNKGEAADALWHVSFHGSSFPGDNPLACGRQAIYSMMDIPRGAFTRTSRAIMEAGKDIEDRLVMKWYLAGYLLSPPPFDYRGHRCSQMHFKDPEVWLTSTVDAMLLSPYASRPFVCEVKTKYAADIEEMLRLYRGPDPKHIFQVKCQIGLAHEMGETQVQRCYNTGRLSIVIGRKNDSDVHVCPQHGHSECLREERLDPIEHGRIYYVSRDKPDDTWEFYFDYDPEFMEKGRAKLAAWKKSWQDGKLPQTNFEDKRFSHPFGWTWTRSQKMPDSPCEWCNYGDICRLDHKAAVAKGQPIELTDSAGIEIALESREDYNIDLIRRATEAFWSDDPVRSD